MNEPLASHKGIVACLLAYLGGLLHDQSDLWLSSVHRSVDSEAVWPRPLSSSPASGPPQAHLKHKQ